MHYKAVLFDLDGTLIDSLADIAAATNRTLQIHGYPTHPLDSYRQFVGDGLRNLIMRAVPANLRADEPVIRECMQTYSLDYARNWNIKTCLYPGMHETLDGLKSRGLKLAVLSNKPDEFTQSCASHYLARWGFDLVWGASSRFPHKPNPAGALAMSQQMRIAPSHFLYVGDMPVDMQTALNAGMTAIGVTWGLRTEAELRSAGSHHIIHHPTDLLALAR